MRYITLILCQLLILSGYGQKIEGKITDLSGRAIGEVTVRWKNNNLNTESDSLGNFTIERVDTLSKVLLFEKIGYYSDALDVGNRTYWNIQMLEDNTLATINIQSKSSATKFVNDVAKVEQLGVREIQRAACCSLAGCFSTNSNVDANTTNIVTDAKELRILGLAGVYNQILVEGMPLVQGLSLPYGPGSFPGTMIEKIFVSKGSNSVLQGFESISGQINIDFHNVETAPKYFFNAFANSFGESQYNANYMAKLKSGSNLFTAHYTSPATDIDQDKDGFRDLVKTKRFSVFNRYKYEHPINTKFTTTLGVRYLNEERNGGQIAFDPKTDLGSHDIYGQYVKINHLEAYSKSNYELSTRTSFIFLSSAFNQSQNANFGVKTYDARQFNSTSALYLDHYYGESLHNVKWGLSHRHNRLREVLDTISYLPNAYIGTVNTDYDVPGLFVENKLNLNKLTILSGIRLDRFKNIGWRWTPRLLLRFAISDQDDVRFSVGKGFRMVHLFSENQNLLASNRALSLNTHPDPEEAWNMGINFVKTFTTKVAKITLSGDYYTTVFQSQIFPDYEKVFNSIVVDNYKGKSLSNSFQIENKWEFNEQFDIKIAYNYLDVFRKEGTEKIVLPFVSKHKWIANGSYSTPNDQWQCDVNFRWYGGKVLPDTKLLPEPYRQPSLSPAYSTTNIQITYRNKNYQVYGGIENLFDFRQNFPIVGYEQPFGIYFDPSFNWGPTKGREYFLGIRYSIKQKHEL
jgi:outer membrane receptor for ferrienterochelin and colicins